MTCRFLENLSLASLIAPADEEEFRARYWETEPLIVHRRDPGYYDGLFTVEDFDAAIMRHPDYVKIANAPVNKSKKYAISTAPGMEAILGDMREGGTIVLDQMHHREPKLGLLCRTLAPEFGHMFQTNLYLTPANGQGFSPHWDNHDVFILQVHGSKLWHIEKSRRVFPARGQEMGDEGRELRGEINTFTLEQGDLIYIPRGFVHSAECGAVPSLHITLGVTAFFFEEVLQAIIKAAVQRDERLRVALPLGFMQGPQAGVVNRAMATLLELSNERFISGVVEQFRDELVSKFHLDVAGLVTDFFKPKALSLDDVVGPRRGTVYRTKDIDDTVRVNFGARSIVFQGFFREALHFALSRPSYAIRYLPGDLADEERIVFIERLLQEGLVVRR